MVEKSPRSFLAKNLRTIVRLEASMPLVLSPQRSEDFERSENTAGDHQWWAIFLTIRKRNNSRVPLSVFGTKQKGIFDMATSFESKGTPEQVDALKAEIFALTLRHYKHITIRRFVNNLWKRDIDSLFRFVTDPDINPTNNISERELRHLVIIRKISNGSRSARGAHATAMLLSVIQTLRMNRKNPLWGMQEILKNASDY